MIIKSYINQINFLFTYLVDYYKQNVSSRNPIDDNDFKKIEKYAKYTIPSDLQEFLNWSSSSPIWGAPFVHFDSKGENFEVWSNRPEIILIKLTSSLYNNKLEIMGGEYILNSNTYIFKICVDYNGSITGLKDSIFILSGKKHSVYSNIFEDINNTKIIPFSKNITEFAEKYLKYLKTIPVTVKKSKKVETLLNDSKKLFKFVKNYNFDEGEDKIEQIINDKRCDLATALLIYWLSQPYLVDEKTGTELNMIPMVIEKNVKDNFYAKSANTFDPANNDITNFIDEYNRDNNIVRKIPDFMLNQKACD